SSESCNGAPQAGYPLDALPSGSTDPGNIADTVNNPSFTSDSQDKCCFDRAKLAFADVRPRCEVSQSPCSAAAWQRKHSARDQTDSHRPSRRRQSRARRKSLNLGISTSPLLQDPPSDNFRVIKLLQCVGYRSLLRSLKLGIHWKRQDFASELLGNRVVAFMVADFL